MTDFVIVGIIIVVVAIGIVYTVKHFKGEGGCCGGGNYKPKKKKLPKVLYKKTFHVEGMHCEHCKNRVEEVVNDIEGVSGMVNLKADELIVSYAAEVSDEEIKAKIERVGYKIV
ncbi:MAG: heavy metal-associated domain-containing protein [Christensenellales bacterium]|nr:heavy metal-associated domain-containing protein [Christensenellales bacterium]